MLFLYLGTPAHATDLTSHLESLIIPFAERYPAGELIYARNVWDLKAFAGRLYVAAGNYDNNGPAPNAGPVPILAWDPVKMAIVNEGQVDEEQIDRFCLINGTLYIPGTDPMESWKRGNLYRRRKDGRWQKQRTIPKAIHVFALTGNNGRLYAGLKATDTVPWYVDFNGYGSAVAVSSNAGKSWKFFRLGGYSISSFLHTAGRLYAADVFPGPGLNQWIAARSRERYYAPMYMLNAAGNHFERRSDLTAEHLFPDTQGVMDRACIISLAVVFADSCLYIGSDARGPFGLYRTDSLDPGAVRTTRIRLPDESIPRDIFIDNGMAFVLLQSPLAEHAVCNHVLASRDLVRWAAFFHFNAPTFARSFEKLDGDFYFGLGCEVKNRNRWHQNELHPETGRLVRLKKEHLPAIKTIVK